MHVCIIAPEQFTVPGNNSVEICILAIAKQLALRNQVTIVSRRMPGLTHNEELEHVNIIRLPADSPSRYLNAVLNYVREKSFDLIQVDNRPRLMAAVQKAAPTIPIVLFLHSLTFVPNTRATLSCLNHADLIIANSRSLQRRLARRFPSRSEVIRIVPLGADLERFVPPSPEERRHLRHAYRLPQKFTVLFVGRIIPRKGVSVLIRSVYLLRRRLPIHLLVVGRGKPLYIRQLKRLAMRLGVSVTFLGNVAHEEIHLLYQAADCFVCPSQGHEAFGLVNVEAMASGLPVIASNNGGIREIVLSGVNGYLVNRYRESLSFSRYLLRVGRNPKLAESMGIQGRKDALNAFDWKHTAARLEELYGTLTLNTQDQQEKVP
ncbi:glycosyltransferase family 4 protein [Paenibacillus wynnii]|uniref:Spore coat protein n=1 Tax=Paenibacillus wynnii TaxID=268407 RepID=A0A098MCE1_9BACL|nr:glycosyltransferase family 4 protein [Paenibacillus wynnii]KGE19718.1 spore coat protein [Paenibacillus wynnii]